MNVIWIVSDTFRRGDMGAYGNKIIHTPSLDAFAAKAIRFDRHYIASFPTMPSRADFMTGRWTMSYMGWEPLSNTEVTLPQILSKKAVHTAAIVDTPFFVRGGMNYDRGFRSFWEIPGQDNSGWTGFSNRAEGIDMTAERRSEFDYFAPKTFTRAMHWLDMHYKEDFFLYIDTWDPHEPWDPPLYYSELYWPGHDGEVIGPPYANWQDAPGYTEEKVKKAYASYCGKITMVDTWFGYFMRKLENMQLMEKTAIIFTTDHGFYFGEHGGIFGKLVFAKDEQTGEPIPAIWTRSPFYEEVAAIPLLIYVPNTQPGTYQGLTSAVDLMPTVVELMGQAIPPGVEGKSLLPVLKNRSLPGRDYVISGQPFVNAGDIERAVDGAARETEKDSCVTVTTDEWSLVYNTEPGLSELYNIKSDPRQEKNMINNYPEVARKLHSFLVQFMKETKVKERFIQPRLSLNL